MRVGFVRKAGLGAVLIAAAALGACNDDPISWDANDTADIFVNPTVMVVPAGRESKLASRAVNPGNEPTFAEVSWAIDPTAGCIDSGVNVGSVTVTEDPDRLPIQPPGLFVVTAGTTLGQTCIVLTSGSLDPETVKVTVVGADVTLVCPSNVRGGDSGTLTAGLVSSDGDPVGPYDQNTDILWETDDSTVVNVDQSGNWAATTSGTAEISATWTGTEGTGTAGTAVTLTATCNITVGGDVPASAAFADADTLGSLGVLFLGDTPQTTAYEVLVFDAFGNLTNLSSEITGISVTSDDPAIATAVGVREVLEGTDQALLSVEVTPVGAGVATISGTVETTEGDLPFSGTVEVVLIPTISASSPADGLVGEVVTLDVVDYDPAAPLNIYIDGDQLDPIFVESKSPTQIVFWMPYVGLGDHEIAIGGSAEELSTAVTFELTSAASADAPGYLSASTAPLTALPLKKVSYLSPPDALNHYYLIEVAAPTTIVIDLDWDSGSDLDILVTDGAFTAYVCTDGATGAQPEQSECELPAAGQYLIWINDYDESRASYVLEAAEQ